MVGRSSQVIKRQKIDMSVDNFLFFNQLKYLSNISQPVLFLMFPLINPERIVVFFVMFVFHICPSLFFWEFLKCGYCAGEMEQQFLSFYYIWLSMKRGEDGAKASEREDGKKEQKPTTTMYWLPFKSYHIMLSQPFFSCTSSNPWPYLQTTDTRVI